MRRVISKSRLQQIIKEEMKGIKVLLESDDALVGATASDRALVVTTAEKLIKAIDAFNEKATPKMQEALAGLQQCRSALDDMTKNPENHVAIVHQAKSVVLAPKK